MKPAEVIEDAEFLIRAGEWPGRIAQRLGYKNVSTLTTALQRQGRHDIADNLRLLDRSSVAYQVAHYTPMDEVVARENRARKAKQR